VSTCDFDIALRIVAADGSTVRGDLNDQANWLILLSPVIVPQDETRRVRYKSPRSHGDFTSGPPLDEPGELVVTVDVEGSTWAQVETRWDAVRDYLRLEWDFFVEYEAEGVTRRWRTERPNITVPAQTPSDIKALRLTYQLRFICQPNPVVTIA
jgi:hypothetical protein